MLFPATELFFDFPEHYFFFFSLGTFGPIRNLLVLFWTLQLVCIDTQVW